MTKISDETMAETFIDDIKTLDNIKKSDNIKALDNLKKQFAIIEGISRDFTDILLIDFVSLKAYMIKTNGNMISVDQALEGEGNDYMPTWEKYCKHFVLAEEWVDLLENVKPENVLAKIKQDGVFLYSYHCLVGNDIQNYQIKFIDIAEVRDNQELVVAAIRNIDDIIREQRRHEKLEEEALRDMLTGLSNRNAYENDLDELQKEELKTDLIYVALDLNGLKVANDNCGHDAGDELLKGAASCLRRCFSPYGKVYRTGGDEFAAVIYASQGKLEELKADFQSVMDSWKGEMNDSLAISVGYASYSEFKELSLREIANIADERMYENKANYYKNLGVDRRGNQEALILVAEMYDKIFRINLENDSYTELRAIDNCTSDQSEKGVGIERWFKEVAIKNNISPGYVERFENMTKLSYIDEMFRSGKKYVHAYFYGMVAGTRNATMFDIMPSKSYGEGSKSAYVYIKFVGGADSFQD